MTPHIENPTIKARQQFADANGWRIGKWFSFQDLVGRQVSHHDASYSVLVDHGECFRDGRRPAAIVGHNYSCNDESTNTSTMYGTAGVTRVAEHFGLVVHVAPAGAAASWYFPNHSTLLVITRPGVEVVWPTPRQMVDTAIGHAIYHERMRRADRELEERTRLRRQVERDFGSAA
jgi:hypothetical protein